MICRLSHYQQRSVRHRVPELHAQAMLEHRVVRGRTMHDVELPPIAWRQILDTMREQCFGPMGGRLDRGVPKSAYSAIKKIAEAVMRIENHPALYERAVEGWVGEVILAWGDFGQWSPYPNAALHCWLTPQHITVHGRQCTIWLPKDERDIPTRWSLRPRTHLMFVDAQSIPSI